MIHIGVSWDWNDNQMIDVPVITNCNEAELFLNGESLGRMRPDLQNPDRYVPVWKIPFSPGKLTAKGYDDAGNVICEDQRFTPGETEYLSLTCEDEFLLSDGWDCVFVTVTAEDAEHHPVENARDRVRISVTGGGRLLGTDNGDSTDPDGYKSDCRRLFSGKLLLIIGSNGLRQDACVCVNREGGREFRITIPVKYTSKIPGVSCGQESVFGPVKDCISVRRVDICALSPTDLTPERQECSFAYKVLPSNAAAPRIDWQVTNAAGIESPCVHLRENSSTVTVQAYGDGLFYLRALCFEEDECRFISQVELNASGFGNPAFDPFSYISAGLYDIHEGDIGTGNEKGIAFSRDGESMAGFSRVDFGKTGSDVITADIFALNGDPYDMELLAAVPGEPLQLICMLHYEKPSIWNVYQAETWKLPVRLTGVKTIGFRMKDKVHMKGFVFEKQSGAWLRHTAGSAESIYGDAFNRCGETVTGIGNNVTLSWTDMDFGQTGEIYLEIEGNTPLPVNSICVRIRNSQGEEINSVADFQGPGKSKQTFRITVPEGNCTVSFVFLPGSSFDFEAFCFKRPENWTDRKE